MKIKLRGERKQDAAVDDAKFCGVAAAMVGGAVIGAYSTSQSNDSADERQQQAIAAAKGDPRAQAMLYGDGSANSGLLNQYQSMLGTPQNDAMKQYGQEAQQFLSVNNSGMTNDIHQMANQLMGGNVHAPGMSASTAQASQVNAPGQNNMNLTGSYDKFINGDAGANPYLTKAIQGGIDQSTNQFRQMQGEATDNLQRNVLPGIRSNSVLTGQYGGSRQGVAEGNAISDMTKQLHQSMTQFGQNNTNQAVGAQASSFNQGQDRALSATQGLGAQQYGVASQNASLGQQNNQFNAGLQQDAAHQNVSSTLSTDQLNTGRQTAGIAANTGLLGTAAAASQAQDDYALGRAGKVNGLLQPYLGQPGVQTQPMYQGSTAGGLLGGAMAGAGMYNMFNQGNSGMQNAGTLSDLYSTSGNSVFGAGGMWGNGK
jgi:hypothetical protein